MIQLQVVSGKQAGTEVVARRFPFLIGRDASSDLRAEEPGVWERHVEIGFDPAAGFSAVPCTGAVLLINGERSEGGNLRNGDMLELGGLKLRFWLTRSPQNTMRIREVLTWAGLLALFALQLGVIYALLK